MARLTWGAFGERFFEVGVDRGVLYLTGQAGVPWNGLTAVSESPSGGDARPFYLEGQKYLNFSASEEFEATIQAFGAPAEFAVCDGTAMIMNGLFVTQQRRQSFGLSYRTRVGNDSNGVDHGYKLHLVYNALAAPSERGNATIGDSTDPISFSWAITTVPAGVAGFRPTAHYLVDSRQTHPTTLAYLEAILYGSDGENPRQPTASELKDIFATDPETLIVPS